MAANSVPMRRALPAASTYARELWDRREFAWFLALGNLKARNASTALGLIWWVLNPLLLGAIYGLVFGVILDVRRGVEDYLAYLLAGIFPFYYTRSAMTGGVGSIISNAKLISNLRFPRMVLPLSAMVESAVGFLVSIPVYYLIVGPVLGVWPTATVVWLLPAFVIMTLFNLGLSALVARFAVPFRDINNLVPYFTRLWLYLSPIIYPTQFLEENVSGALSTAIQANPLFSMLAIFRHGFMGLPLSWGDVAAATAWALVALVGGVGMFIRYESRMTRYL